jgi:hypothetical protein
MGIPAQHLFIGEEHRMNFIDLRLFFVKGIFLGGQKTVKVLKAGIQ